MSIFTCDNKDEFIFDIFPSTNCYFVDVGASDGVYGSNTFSLEKRGWSGICIEPHPSLLKELDSNRECKIDPSLCSSKAEIVDFAIQKEEAGVKGFLGESKYGGYAHAWRGGSGIIENWIPQKVHSSKDKYDIQKTETKTLTEILDSHNCPNYIEFLDVDTEGNDYNVLEGIDWDKYRFASIMIEKNSKNVQEKLDGLGYTMEQEFSEEYLYIDTQKKGLLENVKNIKNIGYWSRRIFGETCLRGASL